MKQGVSEDFPL